MFKEKIEQIGKRIRAREENKNLREQILTRLNSLTKPTGSLGRLEDFVLQYCLCRENERAGIKKAEMYVFAADHGITEEGVSPYPYEVTEQMVLNMISGGAAINILCRNASIDCKIVDIGVKADFIDHPLLVKRKVRKGTRNFFKEPAMTEEECCEALKTGHEIACTSQADIMGVGEMGIGNTSSSSALYCLFLDEKAENTVGRGTGACDRILAHKIKIVTQAVNKHKKEWDGTPFEALRRMGGLEIAGMAGFILGAAEKKVPVVIDGFTVSAAALTALCMIAEIKDYLYFAHCSAEKFHKSFLESLDLNPVLNLGMRLGEGTGSALAIMIIRQALNCYHQMATFSEAGVSERS